MPAEYLQQKECARGECNLGNFYTDAMLHAFIGMSAYNQTHWSNVSLALTTQGNFRVPLPPGNLSYSQLISMCPWENKLIALTLKGNIIRALLEDSVAPMKSNSATPTSSRFLQVSGFKIVYNLTQPVGQRVTAVKVRCQQCLVPVYVALVDDENYRVVVMEYLANGKNGFHLISDNAKDLFMGPGDLEAFIRFMQIKEPITAGVEGRIKIFK